MFIIYDLIFAVFVLIYLPVLFFKNKFHPGFWTRFGFLPKTMKEALEGSHPVWLHTVSVGEVLACRKLIDGLRKAFPDRPIVLSTITPTGNKLAKSLAGVDFVIYLPLDFSFITRPVIGAVKPAVFIIAETEIWPNLINELSQMRIPIITVNTRISDSSFNGYKAIKFMLKPILDKISLFCVQTELDAERLRSIGAKQGKIEITGNMKFDVVDFNIQQENTDYRKKIGLPPQDKLLVCGSTHPGEEQILIEIYKRLSIDFPCLRLLIAPRHPHRAQEIEHKVRKYGFAPIRISQAGQNSRKNGRIFILDTIGELIFFYGLADIVFMGGSLVKRGGHNILEPAFFSKPIIFGPYMFNFRDITNKFIAKSAAIQINDKEDLYHKLRFFLAHPNEAEDLGRRANEILFLNKGATQKNLEKIKAITRGRFSDQMAG